MGLAQFNEITTGINFENYLTEHEKEFHADKIQSPGAFKERVLKIIRGEDGLKGDPMPWMKTQDKIRFREGEVTMWAGVNGNGKSLVTGQCILSLAQYRNVGLASFEMLPERTLHRMYRQCSGSEDIPEPYIDRINDKLNLFVYDHMGSLKTEKVYGMIHYMAIEKNCKHIFIDSLMKCGVDSEHNEPQKKFISKIQDIAKEHRIHIHIVHHARKSQHETDRVDKFSVKGAGELVDMVDNLLLVARNTKKELLRESTDDFDDQIPDCYLSVPKQRNGDFSSRIAFWFEPNSTQWCETPDRRRHTYIQ